MRHGAAAVGAELVPDYGAGSLAELLPSVCGALHADGFDNVLGLVEADAYVVLLVDGMGLTLLQDHPREAPFLSSLLSSGRSLTSALPSTTATSLATMGVGVPTGSHGLVGYTSRIPGTTELMDALRWDPRVDPLRYQSRATVFERARAAGVATANVSRRQFATTGLTLATLRGADFAGADTRPERIDAAVRSARRARSVTYVYDGKLDGTGHTMGCRSSEWRDQLSLVDDFARELGESLPTGTVLIVTADHGMVDVPTEARVDVDDDPDLLAGVQLVGGEARFRHLYCHPGAATAVAERWRQRFGPSAIVLTRGEAIDRGWFGAVEDRVADRFGDVVVACVDVAVLSGTRFPLEVTLVGLHGSVTAEEMLVPLLIATS
jgi:hypothetical protein